MAWRCFAHSLCRCLYNAGILRVRSDSRALRMYSLMTSSGRCEERANVLVSSGNFANAVAMSQATPMRT